MLESIGINLGLVLVPQILLNELANIGHKHTPDEVVMITRTSDGMLKWLEIGDKRRGFYTFFRITPMIF